MFWNKFIFNPIDLEIDKYLKNKLTMELFLNISKLETAQFIYQNSNIKFLTGRDYTGG